MARIFVQASAIELAHIAERSRKSQSNFRASERRAELVRAMPSAAENLKANFRASECRAELVRAMPSAAENVKKRCIYMNVKI